LRVAVAAAALVPATVLQGSGAMVFTAAPAVLLFTFTMMVQPPAGIVVPLASTKFPAPAVAGDAGAGAAIAGGVDGHAGREGIGEGAGEGNWRRRWCCRW